MGEWLIIMAVSLPIIAGIILLVQRNYKNRNTRNVFVFISILISTVFVVAACINGGGKELFTLLGGSVTSEGTASGEGGIRVAFKVDGISILFACLSVFMWLTTSLYSFEYMKHEKHEKVFYAFFLMTLVSVTGLCISANLITFYMFYEFMMLTTIPLVLHTRKREALGAALKYLIYSIGGALLSLFGIFILSGEMGVEFTMGGNMNQAAQAGSGVLIAAALCIIGFGSKAGMFPLHGWLPTAHPVAPSPASALLSGNITKMGVLAIIRVVYYVIGADKLTGTWLQYMFIALSLTTVLMGSMMAYKERVLKKRLAYSSVSQVSYILFGLALMNTTAFTGALLHVVFHSIIKNALFYTAGIIIIKTGKTRVDELRGIGKQLPHTMLMFSVAALALVGIPPFSGFVSKWYLCLGALESGTGFIEWLGPVVLLVSALLTAGYLFPISMNGFFPGKEYLAENNTIVRIEPTVLTRSALLILTVATFVLGVAPGLLSDILGGLM